MVADASTGFERMKNNFKADLYEMQAEHGRVMGAIKFGGMQMGKAMSGIMSAIGYIGIAVMLFQMGKQIFNMFKKVDERLERIKEEVNEQAQSFANLADELDKTTEFFQRGIFSTFEERVKAIGGAFQSADLPGKFRKTRIAISRLGMDAEETTAIINGLQLILDELGELDPEVRAFAEAFAFDPEKALKQTVQVERITRLRQEEGEAITAVTRAQANYEKQINAFNQKIKKIPYQDVIVGLQELARQQAISMRNAKEGSEDQARLNAEFGITVQRMEAFKGLFRAATIRTHAFAMAQRAALRAATALVGDKTDINKDLEDLANRVMNSRIL